MPLHVRQREAVGGSRLPQGLEFVPQQVIIDLLELLVDAVDNRVIPVTHLPRQGQTDAFQQQGASIGSQGQPAPVTRRLPLRVLRLLLAHPQQFLRVKNNLCGGISAGAFQPVRVAFAQAEGAHGFAQCLQSLCPHVVAVRAAPGFLDFMERFCQFSPLVCIKRAQVTHDPVVTIERQQTLVEGLIAKERVVLIQAQIHQGHIDQRVVWIVLAQRVQTLEPCLRILFEQRRCQLMFP